MHQTLPETFLSIPYLRISNAAYCGEKLYLYKHFVSYTLNLSDTEAFLAVNRRSQTFTSYRV